ncbi:bifunctional diguanylate cyclase/phosphodiesterase [Leeia oryzae]|uniref:bifunctional diguanylate cyclase/phosphodiesterase n=1 Tax=Leeia oryzae TaxID=356662 RepID=UPI00035D601E|nr:EAL domain-containing protein [Leeia oryzae]
MLTTVITATGSILWRLHNDTLERQVALANLTTRAIEDHLTQSLTVVERTLTLAASDPIAAVRLPFYLQQAPYLRSISFADPGDRIYQSSNAENIGIKLDRRVFIPQSTTPVSVLRSGPLFTGRDFADHKTQTHPANSDLNFIPLLLDSPQKDGSWHTVVAALNTDYFLNFYNTHLTADQGQVDLLRYDGGLLIRNGSQPAGIVYNPMLRNSLLQSETGSYFETQPEGMQLLIAYRASRNYPFIIVVRQDRQQILANWQREAKLVVLVVGSILLLLISLSSVYYLRFEKLEIIRQRDAEQLRIAAAAFESQEGIFVTDADNTILRVNQAFCKITGYSEDEAIGQTPHLLSSGKHPPEFYQEMWQQLHRCNNWSGEIWNRRKNGDIYPEWLTITAVKNAQNHISHYVATLTDITQRKHDEDEIRNLAFYDPLTRLPNRRLLLEHLEKATRSAGRRGNEGALLFIDLDNFKTLNDTLGHDMGDLLLQEVAKRLNQCVREIDTVARLGGDEFVVLLPKLSKYRDEAASLAQRLGERIRLSLNIPYDLAGHNYHATPSIGITMFADGQHNSEELMKRADLALYSAKSAGRNTVHFFDPQMQKSLSERASLEAALRQAISDEQLVLMYQPQVDHAGNIYGAEVLLRWQHPTLGLMPPDQFIPLAEETGLILPIGNWVLLQSCKLLKKFSQQPGMPSFSLSVNVSAKQLRQPDFTQQVQDILDATDAPPHRLLLELTESGLLDDIESSSTKMLPLRHHGVRFALDDFGTGYSSLAYLKKLPIDQLKIDKSFVQGVMSDQNDAAIVRSVLALGNALNLNVLAEGVETEDQLQFLNLHGCRSYQGYLFGRPLPLQELLSMCMKQAAVQRSYNLIEAKLICSE